MNAQRVAADHGETGMGRVDQHSGQGRGVARRNLDDEPRRRLGEQDSVIGSVGVVGIDRHKTELRLRPSPTSPAHLRQGNDQPARAARPASARRPFPERAGNGAQRRPRRVKRPRRGVVLRPHAATDSREVTAAQFRPRLADREEKVSGLKPRPRPICQFARHDHCYRPGFAGLAPFRHAHTAGNKRRAQSEGGGGAALDTANQPAQRAGFINVADREKTVEGERSRISASGHRPADGFSHRQPSEAIRVNITAPEAGGGPGRFGVKG